MVLRLALLAFAGLAVAWPGGTAHAVPAFAPQTGQPCTTCHVAAFGPQVTPFGRAFKIGGHPQPGGAGSGPQFPLAAMVLRSFTPNNAAPPGPAADNFGRNDNF